MPIIPQYRAQGGPAKPGAPAMEPVQRERVDASEALRGMSRLSAAVEGLAVAMPGVPEDLGQVSMRGIQNLGAGVKDLGQSMFDIRERVARAKSFADVSEAQLALDAEVGNFEEWRARNQGNPEAWEGEWATRLERFRNDYLAGKDFPPATQDAINQRVMAFGERHGISVGVEAVKATVGRARESLEAEIVRAVRAKDIGAVEDLTAQGVSEGWIPEDQAERMKWQAAEQIREDELSSALMRSDTYAMRGMVEEGRAEIAEAPFETEDERNFKLAEFDTKTAVHAAINEVQDRLADGEDPNAIRAELEAKDEKGNFTAYRDLSPAARAQLLKPIYAAENEEYSARIEEADDGILAGTIKTEAQLEERLAGVAIGRDDLELLKKKLRGEASNTEENVIKLNLEAAKYDPATDPDGRVFTATRERVALILGDDPRAESVLAMLEKRRRGEELTMGERLKAQKLEEVKTYVDAKGDWRVPSDRIRVVERGGEKLFIDTGADVKPGDPGYFEDDGGFFGRTVKGRVMQLSQDDRIAIEQGKAVTVDDLNAKNRALSDGARIADELARDIDAGKIQTGQEADDKFNGLVAPMRKDGAGAIIDQGLFPMERTPSGAMADPEELRKWLDSYNVTF